MTADPAVPSTQPVLDDEQPIHNPPPSAIAGGRLLPPRARANGTLRRLQEAALVRFGERGYHGVSIRELAEAAGVTVSSVYSHVSAKEDLLVELMVMGHLEHNDWLRTSLATAPAAPHEQMDLLMRAHVSVHATYPLLTRVCNKELHALSPKNAARVMEIRQNSERMFLDVVERGVAAGSFHCAHPWLAVAAIGGMGIRVAEWFDPHGPYSVDDVADAYADFTVKMLA